MDPVKHSDTMSTLIKALSAVQAKMGHAYKANKNPHTGSYYADLAEVIDTCRPLLTEHGFAILQPVRSSCGAIIVTTILAHESGEWISSELEMQPAVILTKADREAGVVRLPTPQELGSTITYARRYSLAAMVCLAQSDDDGHEGSGTYAASRGGYQAPAPEPRPAANPRPAPAPAPTPEPRPAAPAPNESDPQDAADWVASLQLCQTQADLDFFAKTIRPDSVTREFRAAHYRRRRAELAAEFDDLDARR